MQSRTEQSNQSNASLIKSNMYEYKEFFDTHDPFSTTSDDMLDWLTNKHPHATYQDYLDIRKQSADQGYKTAFDLPLTENEFKYRSLLKQFSQWNTEHHLTCVDADSLLDWLFICHRGKALAYDEFLSLAQAGANQGLVTANNVPVSEAEYKAGLVNQANAYINRGYMHMLRVPAGMVAKIWIDATPHFLESREEAYIYNTHLFRLDRRDADNLFYSAKEELMTHGSLKRLMPRAGHVAVTYNNGNLIVIKPSENGYPTIIESASHVVSGFLNTNVQQLVFPSDDEKQRRYSDNPDISADELNNNVFVTNDYLKIGMKLFVAYSIKNPHAAISKLGENNIFKTIENLASVGMSTSMMRLSSLEFMRGAQFDFWDKIQRQLADELEYYGIELIRFNIETPLILDKELAKKMSEAGVINTAGSQAKNSIHEFQLAAEQIKRDYDYSAHNSNMSRQAMSEMIYRVAFAKSLKSFSSNEIDDIKRGVKIFCMKMIEDEYCYFKPQRSMLYTLIESALDIKNNDELHLRYLVAFRKFIKQAPENFTRGLIWENNDDLLSRIDSMIKKCMARYTEELLVNRSRPSILSGLSFFTKKEKSDSVASQVADCDKDEYPLMLNIR